MVMVQRHTRVDRGSKQTDSSLRDVNIPWFGEGGIGNPQFGLLAGVPNPVYHLKVYITKILGMSPKGL